MKSFIIKNDNLKPAFIKNYLKRTQNIENYYFHPASFFIFKINVFEKKFKFPSKTGFYLHSKYQNIDIDDKEDLNFAIKIFNS